MKKKLIYALTLLLGVGVSGCSDFGDMNVNPAVTTVGSASALLTNGLSAMPGWTTERRPGWYAQYFTETQYPQSSLYNIYLAGFTGTYSGSLYDLEAVKTMNVSNNMTQVAKIVQQFLFWQLTDRWGDIPYSQALKGQEIGSPKYDTQEEVYKGMIKALTDASAAIDGSSITGDVVFNGDPASWKRAANSLRMLMAIQLSKRYPTATGYAATEFKAALADGGGYIATNAQNMTFKYDGTAYQNPIFGWYISREDDAESKTMTDILSSLSDARINVYGGSSVSGTAPSSIGAPYGLSEANARAFVSANPGFARVLRGDFRLKDSPVFLVTAAQVALARAEAANLSWTTENASTVYQEGITLSHQQWGLAAPSASYFADANIALGTDNVKKIATQQWIAAYPDGHIAWNVWRKTGFPVLTPAPAASNTSKAIFRRYAYAASEYTNNAVNVQPAADRLKAANGGAAENNEARIWWDQN